MESAVLTKGSDCRVVVSDDGIVFVNDLELRCQQVADFLLQLEEDKRAGKLIDAIEVGVACLERASASRDVDFVRAQIEGQARFVAGELAKIPGRIEEDLRKHIGTKEGQVLAPVAGLVLAVEKVLKDKLGTVQTFLENDIDPKRTDSTLGMAINKIVSLLDPKRDDSVQKSLETAVKGIASEDGMLAAIIEKVLESHFKPMREEIDRLAKEVRGQAAADAALAETIEKGVAFEDEILPTVQCWAKFNGASVDHVGGDRKTGDVVVVVNDPSLSLEDFTIVIEARDDETRRGRKRISDDMAAAMQARGAGYGIYVAKTQAGLAKEIGDWAEGKCDPGPFVACTVENLLTALRFALVETRIQAMLVAQPEADTAAVRKEIERIRAAMRRVRTIKSKSTEIRKGADAITDEAGELQREIQDALLASESALGSAVKSAA